VIQDDLVRYVMSPEGEVLVDYRQRLPGRGAYTHIDRECVRTAVKRQQFDRAFKGKNRKVEGEKLLDELARELLGRVVNLLGMARKSGQALSGSNLVLDSLDPAETVLVLLAEDISDGIGKKVQGKAERAGILCERIFDKGLLGQVLGKGERSVVALKKGALAETMKKEMIRYKQIVGES
jgi:uncharacterized protein